MSPIPLGILASSGGAAGAYELIQSTILSTSQSSVTFSNLGSYSSTYKHLQIRATLNTIETSNNFLDGLIRFNGDNNANYAYHAMLGNGSSIQTASGTSTTFSYIRGCFLRNSGGRWGCVVIDIVDPFSSSKTKTVRYLSGQNETSSGRVNFGSVLWNNTSPITSIEFFPEVSSMRAGSRLSLYGIKG